MKRGKKMILLLAVLALLVGGYIGVQQLNQTQSVTETAGTFDLTAKKAEDIMGINWTKGEDTFSFKYENATWQTADSSAWPVQQDVVQALADQLVALQATRKLEDVSNLADYGLESPEITVTAVWKDGTSTAYSMGDATPFADGYYLSLSGQSGIIYTISSSLSAIFNKTQKDMVAMETIPNVADVTELSVGDAFHAVKLDESKTIAPDQLWYDAAKGDALDGSKLESLISDAKDISWEDLVTVNADEASLKAWQLDEEEAVAITLTGGDTTAAILLGAADESSHYYARLPGSSMVYIVNSGDVSSLLTASAEDMWIQEILPMPYDQLVEATFTTEKGTYRLVKPLTETMNETDQTDTEDDSETEESASMGTDEADQSLWEIVTGLKATAKVDLDQTGDQVLQIHAVSVSGLETTVTFYEYSAEDYLAVVDGGTPLQVSADTIDSLVRTIRTRQ